MQISIILTEIRQERQISSDVTDTWGMKKANYINELLQPKQRLTDIEKKTYSYYEKVKGRDKLELGYIYTLLYIIHNKTGPTISNFCELYSISVMTN